MCGAGSDCAQWVSKKVRKVKPQEQEQYSKPGTDVQMQKKKMNQWKKKLEDVEFPVAETD